MRIQARQRELAEKEAALERRHRELQAEQSQQRAPPASIQPAPINDRQPSQPYYPSSTPKRVEPSSAEVPRTGAASQPAAAVGPYHVPNRVSSSR